MISCIFKKVVEMSKAVIIPECKKDVGGVKEGLSLSPNEKRDGAMGLFSRLLRLDTLKRSSVATKPEPQITYYGVYIPCEIKKGPDEEAIHVYENKSEALELVKRYKLARFKAFHNRQDAISFALRGAEHHDTTDGNDSSVMGEKPYPFKAPSPQDMVALRKSIEKGLATTVRDRVWDNPRYLVSSGNTPAIMQEGSRYNALHVSAKALNAEMCNLILTTVGNPGFVQTLYGLDADAECCQEFAAILVDRYLNTPDKGMNETPLHFAAKFGAEEVVDVLTSFPQCNKSAVNKFGEQPKDERYYVPVVHSEDGSAAPAIGHAFTPRAPPEYWPFLDTFTDLRTPEGLNLLEEYLKTKYETACSFAYSESCAESHHSPDEITLSRISLGNLSQHSPTKNSMLSPVSELCVAMKTCTISSDRPPHWQKTDPIRQRMCRQPSGKAMIVNGDTNPPTNHSVSQLLCIERTCQVFAKRIADALTFSLTTEPEVASESLKGEAKYLQHTMYTYMDDERFKNINFALIHCRLAQLVVFMLKRQATEVDDINNLLEFLLKLRCPNDDVFSSDDEHRAGGHRGPNRVRLAQVIVSHVRCLASFISEVLTESEDIKGPSVSEGECTELWEKAAKCRCDWKIEHFERNSKKNASFRKNRSIFEAPTKMDRLVFDAVSECRVSPTQYPNVYRWRHAVALYPPAERDKWLPQPSADDSIASLASFAVSTPVGRANRAGRTRGSPAVRCSTPCKDTRDDSRAVPLQVSNWLRVTGPNSPRSALASKNLSHNVSFGF
ncbi:hypothetical protein MSG28_009335 [Choristoneura fumiferana]|uniref:Uncharacterized protein n=1 Tax=Choristoneura fumiferana TaxID=7141 RepID=A0ACC0KXN8_CHOFU|nr:hypothetical protein MSG28_009335 [Choristoneura fumiferana]